MEQFPLKRYPVDSKDYKLYEEIGEGGSASVYRALCIPFNEIVAIKILDLERCNNDLDGIRREVHTMNLIDHPKVLKALCSFSHEHDLWVVMPYMAGGSCLHIMKSSYPDGFDEKVIATVLRETLVALGYLHSHGHIHRDVKAGNILLDSNGTVKLADFGVSAGMFDTGDRQRARNTLVGTPCWMAPEVMKQSPSYDVRADIWSFGITALELAHGHAPFSKFPPLKVFIMTLQNAPPGLDYERDKRFSKSFRDMVATCLMKDPKERPTAEKLLKHKFFKTAISQEILARTILEGLPPLGERYKKSKEKGLLFGHNRPPIEDIEHLSQQEYKRGISGWNFNMEDLKNQAALIQDSGSTSSQENICSNWKQNESFADISTVRQSPDMTIGSNSAQSNEGIMDDADSLKGLPVSFSILPSQALIGDSDIREDDANAKFPSCEESIPSDSEMQYLPQHFDSDQKMILSGPLLSENVIQQRGRFKVTSADHSPKGSTSGSSNPGFLSRSSSVKVPHNVSAASILTSLQLMLHQNDLQKEEIVKVITYANQSSGIPVESVDAETSGNFQVSPQVGSLKDQVIQLQQRVGSLVEELQMQKLKNAQLQRQLVRKE